MTALVTGASSGLGRDMARSLAKRGINLILTARREDRLSELKEELVREHGVKVMYIAADLSDEKQCKELYRRVKRYNIDILINNAGYGVFGAFDETDLDSELDMISVNIRAFHILFKLFLRDFKSRGCGFILNTASVAGFMPGPLFSSYYASKAYVTRMTQAVWLELFRENSGVKLAMFCPGPVNTEFNSRAGAQFAVGGASCEEAAERAISGLLSGEFMICVSPLQKALIYLSREVPEMLLGFGCGIVQSIREKN